jgi:isopentenyl diphosphate isomerase/L-lactate dehydrogenase-like FMN-dependent dehydrogenase
MKIFGCDLRWRTPEPFVSVEDYRRAARRKLPPMVWTYVDGGADDLVTLNDNRSDFANWNLRSRALTGHGKPDLSTTVAGVALKLPVMFAPTGFTGLSRWRGDIEAARAAEKNGTRYVLSTSSSWSIEEVADAATESHFFQLYPREGDLTAKLMARAWNAGYRVLFLTVDVPVIGNRESDRREGMGRNVVLTPRRLLTTALHPRWVYESIRYQRIGGRNLVEGGAIRDALQSFEIQSRELMQSKLNWDDLAWVRDQWKGPIFVKGILDPEDASRAVSLGVDGIVVSNHGGRQLDFAGSSISMLADIVAAIGGRAEVLLDGGIRRGTDVVKAIALGAKAVMVGRPYLYGLAVAGEQGANHILEIFYAEIERALMLMGAPSIKALDPSWLKLRHASRQVPDPVSGEMTVMVTEQKLGQLRGARG